MESYTYIIDGREHKVNINKPNEFSFGKKKILSQKDTDISFDQEWYSKGYKVYSCFDIEELSELRHGVSNCVKNIISSELGIFEKDFELIKYHELIRNENNHQKIIRKTSKLFFNDFDIILSSILLKFENILGFKLTNINPRNRNKHHIIIRINRPLSSDYKPPHKDIYGGIDNEQYIPKYINFWIPIYGVTTKSSLPIVPSSHLISEDKILRTKCPGSIDGKTYHVRSIKSWNNCNKLQRVKITEGEILIFSSHLIHGLAINEETDQTRIALEFRLYKS